MKFRTFVLLLITTQVAWAIEPDFGIGGLVTDETLSPVGHLFYEEFVNHWDSSEQSGTITVHERFDSFAGNVIWIDVNDNTVFQDRVGIRSSGIEEKAQSAHDALKLYLQQNKDIFSK